MLSMQGHRGIPKFAEEIEQHKGEAKARAFSRFLQERQGTVGDRGSGRLRGMRISVPVVGFLVPGPGVKRAGECWLVRSGMLGDRTLAWLVRM